MRPEAVVVGMSGPTRWHAARAAWRPAKPPGGVGRTRPSARRTRSGSGAPRPRPNAHAGARSVVAKRPKTAMRHPMPQRRAPALLLRCTACAPPTRAGTTVGMPTPVWMGPVRSWWLVTSRRHRTTRRRPPPWRQRRRRRWRRRISRGPKTTLALPSRFRRPWRVALTARRQPRRWRHGGSIRPGRQGVRGTRPRRLRALSRHARPQNRWRRKCRARKGMRCTPGARSWWNRCVVRAKRDVVAGDFCCAAGRRSAVHGAECA